MAEGKFVTAADLGLSVATNPPTLNLRVVRQNAETQAIRQALVRTGGNISRTAELLGITRPTLYDLMAKYGVRADDARLRSPPRPHSPRRSSPGHRSIFRAYAKRYDAAYAENRSVPSSRALAPVLELLGIQLVPPEQLVEVGAITLRQSRGLTHVPTRNLQQLR